MIRCVGGQSDYGLGDSLLGPDVSIPNVYTDPDGNYTTNGTYNSATEAEPLQFNNGFTNVSFAAASYSIGYYDFSGQSGCDYRRRASDVEMISTTLDYYNIKNAFYTKIAYDTYDIGKVSPAVGKAGKVIGGAALAANIYDYGTYLGNGGEIYSPQSALILGDMVVNRVGLSSAPGFLLTVGWEAGKALGRYKNYLEKKRSPGGLDGLISTPE